MNPRWDESEFVFCDLQAAARYIRRDNPAAAHVFLEAAITPLNSWPAIGVLAASAPTWVSRRSAPGAWTASGVIWSSIASCRIESRFGVCCTARATYTRA